jgi:hypothetical protein
VHRAILDPKHFQQFSAIVQSTYPNILQNTHNSSFFQDGAILAPNNVIVDAMNNYLLDLIPRKEKTYLNYDSLCNAKSEINMPDDVHTP